jgi:hypothetical protein
MRIKKLPFRLEGTITKIHPLVTIKKIDRTVDFKKVLLEVITDDGQVLFPELTNSRIEQLQLLQITEGSKVRIDYIFTGSVKNHICFNNIFIDQIVKISSNNVENY